MDPLSWTIDPLSWPSLAASVCGLVTGILEVFNEPRTDIAAWARIDLQREEMRKLSSELLELRSLKQLERSVTGDPHMNGFLTTRSTQTIRDILSTCEEFETISAPLLVPQNSGEVALSGISDPIRKDFQWRNLEKCQNDRLFLSSNADLLTSGTLMTSWNQGECSTAGSSITSVHESRRIMKPNFRDFWEEPHRNDDFFVYAQRLIYKSSQYSTWRTSTEHPLLWITGCPGVGKTTLMSSVYSDFVTSSRPREMCLLYAHDPSSKSKNLVLNFTRVILHMLRLNSRTRKENNSLDSQAQIEDFRNNLSLSSLLSLLSRGLHRMQNDEKLVLILDGLDQCEENQAEDVVALVRLLSCCKPTHQLKCVFSMRSTFLKRYLHILNPACAVHIDLNEDLSARQSAAMFVNWTLCRMEIPNEQRHLLMEITERKANWTWLRANLILTAMADSGSAIYLPENNLDVWLLGDVTEIYQSMLSGIKQQYRHIMQLMLRWVVFAAQPLKASALVEALEFSARETVSEEDISRISCNLIIVRKDRTVSLIHQSAIEYFQCVFDNFSAHEEITQVCLRVQSMKRLLQSFNLLVRLLCSKHAEEGHYSSLQDYAQSNWQYHYKLAEKHSDYLTGLLHRHIFESLERENLIRCPYCVYRSLGYDSISQDIRNIALMVGIQFDLPKLVKLELEMGADSKLVIEMEIGPLFHSAVTAKNLATVKTLLSHGADVNAMDSLGCTALTYAAARGDIDIFNYLLGRGVYNPGETSSTSCGLSPTQYLSMSVRFAEVCKSCDEMQMQYTITEINPNGISNPLKCIHILGRRFSKKDLALLNLITIDGYASAPASTGFKPPQSILVSWFPEIGIEAIRLGSRFGVDLVFDLLKAAGNNIQSLESRLGVDLSVSDLPFSSLQVS